MSTEGTATSEASAAGPAQRYAPGMDARSTRVAERLNTPMLIAAVLTIPAVAIGEARPTGTLGDIAVALNWGTWLAFVFELVAMLVVVPDRRAWLAANPLALAIVFLTPPVLPPALQSLRLLRMLRLLRLMRLAQLTREIFSLRGLHYAALLAALTALCGGMLFVAIEPERDLDLWEGVYWAITTMTTLGSSYTPTTTGGEVISAVVLIVGIGFVALLTGAFAQRFLAPDIAMVEEELRDDQSAEAVALRELRSVREQIQALELSVQRIVDERERG